MQAKEICSIIKTCAKSGVTELSIGDMKIQFSVGAEKKPEQVPTQGELGAIHSDSSHGSDDPKQLELQGMDEDYSEQFENAQLMIDSPQDFEQSIIDEYWKNMEAEGPHEAHGR